MQRRVPPIKIHAFDLSLLSHPSCLQYPYRGEFYLRLVIYYLVFTLFADSSILSRDTTVFSFIRQCSFPIFPTRFQGFHRGWSRAWMPSYAGKDQLPAIKPSLLLCYLCSGFHHLSSGRGLLATFAQTIPTFIRLQYVLHRPIVHHRWCSPYSPPRRLKYFIQGYNSTISYTTALFPHFFLQGFRGFTEAGQGLEYHLMRGKHQLPFCSGFHRPSRGRELPIYLAAPHSYQILLLGPSLIPSYTGELQLPATNSNLYQYVLFRSSSSIQGERITDNLCIDDSYLNNLLFLRISTLAPSHYRRPTSSHPRLSTHR